MADHAKLIGELKERMAKLPPLPGEPDFATSDNTVIRYLKSRDWDLNEAEKMLTESVEYRRKTQPLTLECSWCHNRPGYHSMRQVGHDEAGRPVIYANFAQASTHRNTAEDSVAHVVYLIENAKRTMPPGVNTWVFVIDCTGMTLSSCNPKLGYGVTHVLSSHYPERLGLVVCLHHSPVFHGVWKAIKQFLHPQTAAKVKLLRSKAKVSELFSQLFSPDLSVWLHEEMALNKQKPLPRSQLEFWDPPSSPRAHDPRGCPDYVSQHLLDFKERSCAAGGQGAATPSNNNTTTSTTATSLANQASPLHGGSSKSPQSAATLSGGAPSAPLGGGSSGGLGGLHKPHPNIVDRLCGRAVSAVALSKEELQERLKAEGEGEGEGEGGTRLSNAASSASALDDMDDLYQIEIPSDLQIPATALPLSATAS